jgi:MerR family transcriptional regulator, light-induced transcriptional regulator
MYTIKQAARLTGVSEASLRAWERRYEVVAPHRTEAGYRIYSDADLAVLRAMRRLVDAGSTPSVAARTVRSGGGARIIDAPDVDAFVRAAARVDVIGIERALDRGLALGSFEHAVEHWLFPALAALGDAWADGTVDVAGEHAASAAAHRRLAAAFQAAGHDSRAPRVVVGLPPGSQHELGALAFATALKRKGLDVVYLGANVPEVSWVAAVTASSAAAAVLAVVMPEDRRAAASTARRLLGDPEIGGLVVAAGGRSCADLVPGVHALPASLDAGAQALDDLLRGSRAA